MSSPSSTNHTGTTCGRPSFRAVATLAVRVLSMTNACHSCSVMRRIAREPTPLAIPQHAAADIRTLRAALAVDTETLQTEPGNQRALAAVADAALTESPAAGKRLGRRFLPDADSV